MPVLSHYHSKNHVFGCLGGHSLFQFVPIASESVLSLGITEKRLALSICFTPSLQVFVRMNRQVLHAWGFKHDQFVGSAGSCLTGFCASLQAGTDHPR